MKPFTSFTEQLNKLKTRNMKITNTSQALMVLKEENYYRLSGYFKLFTKNGSDDFVDNFSFRKLLKIYNFDSELRIILDKYLAKIEINARTRIAYNLAKSSSPISYLDSNTFDKIDYFNDFIKNKEKEIKHNLRNPMINRYNTQDLPIWVLVEILSFGCLSRMFANLKSIYKTAITHSPDYKKSYFNSQYENLLLIASNLRNICAHHSRLYGKKYPFNISLTRLDTILFNKYKIPYPNGSASNAFELIFSIFKLLPNESSKEKLIFSLKMIFIKYGRFIDKEKLGFNKNWDKVFRKC